MKLSFRKSFILYPISPFHFDGTFHKPSHFPNKLQLDDWQLGKYWQVMRIIKKLYGIKIEDIESANNPKLKVSIYSSSNLSDNDIVAIKKEIIYRYELDKNLSNFIKLIKKDKRFAPIFIKWLGMRNSCEHNLYELLIIGIVLQNATVRRSIQMLDTLLDKYGERIEFDNRKIYAIWLPEKLEKITEQELRSFKIGYRAKFIKKLTNDFLKEKINEYSLRQMSKEKAKKELIKLYGVGPETARILLFEALHHYDTFDHIAPWQQKIYSNLFYNKPLILVEKIKQDILKLYGEYSMLAVHYIWEDIFWQRRNKKIDWLEKEIRI